MNELITRIETMRLKPADVIVLFFNTKDFCVDMVNKMFNIVQNKFPNNTVIALPDIMMLEGLKKEVLLERLNNITTELM